MDVHQAPASIVGSPMTGIPLLTNHERVSAMTESAIHVKPSDDGQRLG
jgi:hypothetical protein